MLPRVALFIDAENASPHHADDLVKYCEGKGWLAIRRCYGSEASLKGWEDAMAAYHIIPMPTPPSAAKANASDFSLTIDAVSLLHRDGFDHAVIASSDADFILLALHFREHGKSASGIGTHKADARLRSAFNEFHVLSVPQVLQPPVHALEKPKPKPVAEKSPSLKPAANAPAAVPAPKTTELDSSWLLMVCKKLADPDGQCNYESYKRTLAKERKGYQCGHVNADGYIKKSGLFEVKDKMLYLREAKKST